MSDGAFYCTRCRMCYGVDDMVACVEDKKEMMTDACLRAGSHGVMSDDFRNVPEDHRETAKEAYVLFQMGVR